jgi:hypothetical protein
LKRVGLFLAAGIGAYLLILLAGFPAGKLTGHLQQQYPPLAFQAVSGSVFSGSAGRIEHGTLVAGPVNWSLRPSGLLKGRLEYRLQGSLMQNPFEGIAAVDLAGHVHIHDSQVVLDPASLVEAYSPVGFTTTGRLTLRVESLELRDGFPSHLDGLLGWSDASVTEPVSLELGEVDVLLGSKADRITGEVSNDGDTRVTGSLALSASHEYRIDLQLTPGRATSPEIIEFLKTWGQPGPGGSYRLVDSGQL